MSSVAVGYTLQGENPVVATFTPNNKILAVGGAASDRHRWGVFVSQVCATVGQHCTVVAGESYPTYLSANAEVIYKPHDIAHMIEKTPQVVQRHKFGVDVKDTSEQATTVVLLIADLESFPQAEEFVEAMLTLARTVEDFVVIVPTQYLTKAQAATVEHAVFFQGAPPAVLAQYQHLMHTKGTLPENCYSNRDRTIALRKI